MGTVRATFNAVGYEVNGVILGEPAIDGDDYLWDYPGLPDGRLNQYGTIVTAPDLPDVPIETFVGTRDVVTPDPSVPAPLSEVELPQEAQ